MAVTSLEVPFRADVVHWRRRWHWPRWLLPFTIGLLIAGLFAAAAARIDYAANYQPLLVGTGDGPVSDSGFHGINDGFGLTRVLVTAKPGTTATYHYTVENTGSDPVTIYDVPQSPSDWLYTSLRWTTSIYYGTPDHALPVAVKPHQSIELLFSIRKPVCPAGERVEINSLTVHTRAFGFSHTIVTPLYGRLAPFEVCW